MLDSLRMLFYQVNRPDVVMESFEGEVIIIHMQRGNYYSLRGSAPLIWDMIDHGYPLEKTSDYLAKRYPGHEEEIRVAVRNLAEELIAENLLVPLLNPPTDSGEIVTNPEVNGPFAPPLLERYTDMQELLLLDPIHDVDETGWPARKAPNEG
jgi:hypothetical protein